MNVPLPGSSSTSHDRHALTSPAVLSGALPGQSWESVQCGSTWRVLFKAKLQEMSESWDQPGLRVRMTGV